MNPFPSNVARVASAKGWTPSTAEHLLCAHERRLGIVTDRADPMLGAVIGLEAWLMLTFKQPGDSSGGFQLWYHPTSRAMATQIGAGRPIRNTEYGCHTGVLIQALPIPGQCTVKLLVPSRFCREDWPQVTGPGLDGWLVPADVLNQWPRLQDVALRSAELAACRNSMEER